MIFSKHYYFFRLLRSEIPSGLHSRYAERFDSSGFPATLKKRMVSISFDDSDKLRKELVLTENYVDLIAHFFEPSFENFTTKTLISLAADLCSALQ